LPLLENVRLYRTVDSIDFLRRLNEEQIFSSEVSNDPN
jgi:hypothetical protein